MSLPHLRKQRALRLDYRAKIASGVKLESVNRGDILGCVRAWWIFPKLSARRLDRVMDAFGVVNSVQQRRVEGWPEKMVGEIFFSCDREQTGPRW